MAPLKVVTLSSNPDHNLVSMADADDDREIEQNPVKIVSMAERSWLH